MGARHRARAHSIQVMRIEVIAAAKARRANIRQFHVSVASISSGAPIMSAKILWNYHPYIKINGKGYTCVNINCAIYLGCVN